VRLLTDPRAFTAEGWRSASESGEFNDIISLFGTGRIKALAGDHDQPAVEQNLREAASRDDVATVRQILNSGTKFDINATNPDDEKTALHYAVERDNIEIVRMLLDAKADPNIKNEFGDTPLAFAAASGSEELIEALIEGGADLTIEDDVDFTPFERAEYWGSERGEGEQKFAGIPSARANAEILRKAAQKQLQETFKTGDWTKAEALIRADIGIDPQARYEHAGEDEVSLLSFAAGEGQLEAVKALVEKLPEDERAGFINALGSRGRTALHSAAEGKHTDVYEYLESQGGAVDVPADDGRSPHEMLTGETIESLSYGPPTENTKRPPNDRRSAQEILDSSKLWRNLTSQIRGWLENGFGGDHPFKGIKNIETDADAAYRAVRVLDHVVNYDKNGAKLTGDEVGNERISGFFGKKGKLQANPNTEAARVQDFAKEGYGTLKGGEKPPVSKEPPTADTRRPEGDNRSAQQIINEDPLLRSLHQETKDWLNNGFGGDHPFKGLKSIGGNDKGYEDDADKAYIAGRILEHIENFGPDGAIGKDDNTIGNHRIDGFFKKSGRLQANPHTEAGRLQDFAKYGFDYLKTYDAEVAGNDGQTYDIGKIADELGKNFTYENFAKLVTHLSNEARDKILDENPINVDRFDLIHNPDKYDVKTRALAYLELQKMRDLVTSNPQMHTYEATYLYASDEADHSDPKRRYVPHSDPKKIDKHIEYVMGKLMNDDVAAWIGEHQPRAIQDVLAKDPALRKKVQGILDNIVKEGHGVDEAVKKDGDLIDNLREHYALFATLNTAAGTRYKDYIESPVVDIRETDSYDEIVASYEDNLRDPNVLTKMIEDGKTPDEAIAELHSRAALFSFYGSPPDDVMNNVNENIQNYVFSTTNGEDLVGYLLKENGDLDDTILEEVIQETYDQDPDHPMFMADNGDKLSVAQVATGMRNIWDTFRSTGKWNHSLKKFADKSTFLAKDNAINRNYGIGTMHAFSALLAGAGLIAKGVGGGSDPSRETIVSTLGSGLQVLGLLGEASALASRVETDKVSRLDKWRTQWNTHKVARDGLLNYRHTTPAAAKAFVGHYTNIARVVSATGGSLVMGAALAFGIEAARRGDGAEAALYITAGVANAATAPTAFYQSLAPYFRSPGHVIKNAPLWGGRIGAALNGAASWVFLGVSVALLIWEVNKEKDYIMNYVPTLEEYDIDGGYDPEYRMAHSNGIFDPDDHPPEDMWAPWEDDPNAPVTRERWRIPGTWVRDEQWI
jgi:ankyrin repeat protein